MEIKFSDIENAFEYVSSAQQFINSALLDRESGRIFYLSEDGDSEDVPEDVEENEERYVSIPHKNDLDLGRRLILDFTGEYLPEEIDSMQQLFRQKGAYSRYKNFLMERKLLDQWYSYENQRTESALRKWCAENGIKTTD